MAVDVTLGVVGLHYDADQQVVRTFSAEAQVEDFSFVDPTMGVASVVGRGAKKLASRVVKQIDANELGQLRSIGQNVWESTAGLKYSPDREFGNRVKHVLNHAENRPSRSIHGVFNSRNEALSLVDEAWQIIQRDGIQGTKSGNKTIYTVDLEKSIGYIGGQEGASLGHPTASHLQLIIKNANEVITVFPIIP